MEINRPSFPKFDIGYKIQGTRVIAQGTITTDSANYHVSLDIPAVEQHAEEQLKAIYDHKIWDLIHDHEVGENIQELHITDDTIKHVHTDLDKGTVTLARKPHQNQLNEDLEDLKKQFYPIKERAGNLIRYADKPIKGILTLVSNLDLKDPKASVVQIREILKHPQLSLINEEFVISEKGPKLDEMLTSLLHHFLNLQIEKFGLSLMQKKPSSESSTISITVASLNAARVRVTTANREVTAKVFIAANTLAPTRVSAQPVNDVTTEKTKKVAKTFMQKVKRFFKHTALGAVFYKFFIDGDAPWKQQKYQVAMQNLRDNLILGDGKVGQDRLTDKAEIEAYIRQIEPSDLKTPIEPSDLKTPLEKMTIDVLKTLGNADQQIDQRANYRDFITALRTALNSEEYQHALSYLKKEVKKSDYSFKSLSNELQSAAILLDLSLFRFSENMMYSFNESLMEQALTKGEKRRSKQVEAKGQAAIGKDEARGPLPLSEEQFANIDALDQKYKAPKAITKMESFSGYVNAQFDPHYKANVPYVNYDFKISDKSVRNIRVGTPTIQTHPWSTKINPEFRAFLQAYKILGKKHVYFSLQKGAASGFLGSFGSEKTRTDAIKALEKEFPDTFTCVVLDQDSSFYTQSKDYNVSSLPFENFKKKFKTEMLTSKSFFISEKIKNLPNFEKDLELLMDSLKQAISPGKSNLNIEERKDFIEVFYAVFELYVIQRTECESFNISCKDAIDRAGKSNALLLKMIQILEKTDQEPGQAKTLEAIALAPSFLVKKQTIIEGHERRSRLVNPMKNLNSEAIADQIRSVFQKILRLSGKNTVDVHANPAIAIAQLKKEPKAA